MSRLISASLGATCSGSSASSSNSWNLSLINIYHDCNSEHTGFTCVHFPFSNLFRADLAQRCPVAVVCWLFPPSQALFSTLSLSPGICVTMAQNQKLWKHCRGANTRGCAPTPQMCCWLDPPPWRGDRFWSYVGIQNPIFLSSLWLEEIPHSLVQYLIKNCQSQSHCSMMPNG